MEERIQKLMAQAGIASRRAAETLIEQGRVTVNGKRAILGQKADPARDDIRVDGARLRIESTRIYVMLNKPMGVVTAVRAQEQEARRTVRDLVPVEEYLYPVGRLDADSEGLVLMTNDGELAQKLSHPRYEHPKVYEVALTGSVSDEALDIWRRGVVLDDGPTKPVEIKLLTRDKSLTWIRITMREGRKRQIRRIANTLGYPVTRLVRTQFDTLALGALQSGQWRYLTDAEIKALQDSASSTPRRGRVGPVPAPPAPASPATGHRQPHAKTAAVPRARDDKATEAPRRRSPARRVTGPPGRSARRTPTRRKPARPGAPRRPAAGRYSRSRPVTPKSGARRRPPTRRSRRHDDHSR
jgi:23S rRNA pseudouridine2605 synthase